MSEWIVERTYRTHNCHTRFWETTVLSSLVGKVATSSSDTQEGSVELATLIAAAPDLLEALKGIIDYRDEMYVDAENPPQGEDLRHFTEKRHELWANARKAIAAATSSPVVVKTGGGE